MAENRFKIRICRILRSPLASCKSKDQISDVVDTHQAGGQRYQLIELFSPQSAPFSFRPTAAEESKLPFLSPDVGGRKCPPASPIISPLNNPFYESIPREKKKATKKAPKRNCKKKCSVFAEFPECKYNGLFSSDEEEEDDERARLFPGATMRRRSMEVGDGLAVVKRSSDPYSDFRTSMVEMIVEKEIFAAEDLEKLLQCFLSLNSYHHHKVIIQAFAEIWEALLP